MSTSTIRHTTWVEDSPRPRLELKVRPYWRTRLHGPFLAAELIVFGAVLLGTAGHSGAVGTMVVLLACGTLFHMNGLDESILSSKLRDLLIGILKCVAFGFLLSEALFLTWPAVAPGTAGLGVGVLISGLFPLVLRPLLQCLVARRKLVEGILIVGTGELAGKLYTALVNERRGSRPKESCAGAPLEFPPSGATARMTADCTQLAELVARERISRVIVAERNPQRKTELAAALLDCRLRGLRITDAVDFYEKVAGKIWVDGLDPEWLVYTEGFDRSKLTICLKRCMDVLVAIILILSTAPLLAAIAAAIKLTSRGPVFFRQVRVGLHGKLFVVYKFRSMRQDAEVETGPVWASEQDGRATAVGRLLRRFRLDEIPQAFNVLRGEMSLVGPRPERPYFVRLLRQHIPFYNLRHYVRPGITGAAQVAYHYGASIEDAYEKLQYDLYYAKHISLRRDMGILLQTLKIVLFGRGR
jgi:sugar transferase (PEP-CTERM system associated)